MAALKLCRLPAGVSHPQLVRRLPRNANFRDRTGETVDGCLVVGLAGVIPPTFSAWLFRCRCGAMFVARSTAFNCGRVGCGCRNFSHRLSNSPIYSLWNDLIARCHKPEHSLYHAYGAQGVKVCQRWRKSVQHFAEDVGPRPSDEHFLELINRRLGYRPDNCRWVTRRERRMLRNARRVIEHDGQRLTIDEWGERLGVSRQALEARVRTCERLKADVVEAVVTPVGLRMPCVAARMKAGSSFTGQKRQAK